MMAQPTDWRLPDGTDFAAWEPAWQPRKTLWVDGAHPQASDDREGTREAPLRSITRAAALVEPGCEVRVRPGTYRESITLDHGGDGPEAPIAFVADGDGVVIKGSRRLDGGWERSRAGEGLHRVALAPEWFGSQGNPFSRVNLPRPTIAHMPWARGMEDAEPARRRCGLVFQDGQRLTQAPTLAEAAAAPGRYWVDDDGWTLFLRTLRDVDPNDADIEITDRGELFAPSKPGIGFVILRGFTFAQAGNPFPMPQRGAVSGRACHHWVIEGNRIEGVNALGLDIGSGWEIGEAERRHSAHHIVRGNTVIDCGICGIQGLGVDHALVEDNEIIGAGWQVFPKMWECAGIKVHWTTSCLIRGNRVSHTVAASGIWIDYGNVNTRCTGNICTAVDEPIHAGIFLEASREPNLVDGNIVWGSTAHGIKVACCDNQRIENNLVACCRKNGIFCRHDPKRVVLGRPATSVGHRITGNRAFACDHPFALDGIPDAKDNRIIDHAEILGLAAWSDAWSESQNGAGPFATNLLCPP